MHMDAYTNHARVGACRQESADRTRSGETSDRARWLPTEANGRTAPPIRVNVSSVRLGEDALNPRAQLLHELIRQESRHAASHSTLLIEQHRRGDRRYLQSAL